jgi:hypothetical protein
MSIIQFVSAFGLGAIVTALVQAWLTNRAAISKRRFDEKKECYTGFLDAIHKSDIVQNSETSFYLSHWINRIELVGSKEVRQLCRRFIDTNPINNTVHPDRPEVFSSLKAAMRKDLGITDTINQSQPSTLFFPATPIFVQDLNHFHRSHG